MSSTTARKKTTPPDAGSCLSQAPPARPQDERQHPRLAGRRAAAEHIIALAANARQDAPVDLQPTHNAPAPGGEQRHGGPRLLVVALGPLELERHQPDVISGNAPRREVSLRHAEAVEVLLRDVHAPNDVP